jgi:hypothetical protein
MRTRLLIGCLLAVGLGCGSSKFVPVSGKVMLNGQPLAGASVSFEPLGADDTPSLLPGSLVKTNADGTFTLKAVSGEAGAVPGKHRVRIVLAGGEAGGADDRPRGPAATKTLPRHYNADSKLTFTVPARGTSDALFELKVP